MKINNLKKKQSKIIAAILEKTSLPNRSTKGWKMLSPKISNDGKKNDTKSD